MESHIDFKLINFFFLKKKRFSNKKTINFVNSSAKEVTGIVVNMR